VQEVGGRVQLVNGVLAFVVAEVVAAEDGEVVT